MKLLSLIAFACLLFYAASDLPGRGDPTNRMHNDTSVAGSEVAGSYYIESAYHDAKTPNIVTVILGDYRSMDTLGEQVVIYTAGLISLLILRKRWRGDDAYTK